MKNIVGIAPILLIVHYADAMNDLPLVKTGIVSLHYAAQQGDAKHVEELLGAGADVNQPDERGLTPLFKAAQKNHLLW